MRAMVVVPDGATGSLALCELPAPVAGPGEVLVVVRAVGVNRADLLQRQGKYLQKALGRPGPLIAGMEVAGEIAAVGEGVTDLRVGDRVLSMCGNAYAEQAVVDARLVLPVPETLTWPEAAALPVSLMTAYDALFRAGSFRAGESVLVSGARAAVGQVALQLARAAGASVVLGTSRSAARLEEILARGADHALDGTAPRLAADVREATGGRGVDVLIDHVGASSLAVHLDVLAIEGRLVSVGRLGGRDAAIDLNELARKRLTLRGVTFRTRELDEYAAVADSVRADALAHVEAGLVHPVISELFPLDQATAAQDHLAADRSGGKIVLTLTE